MVPAAFGQTEDEQTFGTQIFVVDSVPSDESFFAAGVIDSAKEQCRNGRTVKLIATLANDSKQTVDVGTSTDPGGAWALNGEISPVTIALEVRAPKSKFGRRGHRNTCVADSVFF